MSDYRSFGSWAILLSAALFAAVGLAACGGGGGSAAAPPAAVSAPVVVSATPAPSAAPAAGITVLQAAGAGTLQATLSAGAFAHGIIALSSQSVLEYNVPQSLASGAVSLAIDAPGTAGAMRRPAALERANAPVPAGPFLADGPLRSAPALPPRSTGPLLAQRVAKSAPVGSTRSFYVSTFSPAGTAAPRYTTPSFTLRALSPGGHGAIWIDGAATTAGAPLSDADVAAIAADFDRSYAADTARFGDAAYNAQAAGNQARYATCDASGAPQPGAQTNFIPASVADVINVLVVDDRTLGGIGGFYDAVNHMPQAVANCFAPAGSYRSNELPIIVVGWNHALDTAVALGEDVQRSTAHELQHLINYVQHRIINNGTEEDRWINEGLSMLAQDYAAPGGVDLDDAVGYHARAFLNHPENYRVTGFSGFAGAVLPSYNCAGCYGAAYLFMRYMADRFGPGFAGAVTQSAATGPANLARVAGAALPVLLQDFATMLAVSNTGLAAGPKYNLQAWSLHAAYRSAYPNYGPYNFEGPHTIATLSAGSPVTFGLNGGLLQGGLAFANVTSPGSAATIRATDAGGGLQLGAALATR